MLSLDFDIMQNQPQQPVNVFPNPNVGPGPAQGHVVQPVYIEQPVPTPPVFNPLPTVVPVYPEGQMPPQQQVC